MTTTSVSRKNGLMDDGWQQTDGKALVRQADAYDATEGVVKMAMLVWDTGTLAWIKYSPTGGGGGGGAVTVADGADVTQGAKADATWDGSSAASGISLWRYMGVKLEAIRVLLAGSVPVVGPLTDTQLRASAVPISAATLPLPTNASTSALQTSGNASLSSLDTKTPALGQALAASSVPVILPAATIATLTPPAAITGFALEAGHLAAIDTSTARIPALGQALAGASVPVVLTAAQQSALTPPAAITGYALDGTDISAPTAMPAGGVGIRGWLSAIWTKLNGSLVVTQATPANLQATVVGADTTLGATVTPKALSVWDISDRAARLVGSVVQGTAAALAGAWPVKVTDGTTAVKVTIGNAQPATSDGALVVNAIDTFAGTALASGSHGVATTTFDIVNYNGKGIRVWQDLTVLGASSVCTFSIQEKDPVSGKFITILASAATGAGINATGTAKLTVYPGLTAAANSVASDVLPVNIRITSTVATAASTFSQGFSIIP